MLIERNSLSTMKPCTLNTAPDGAVASINQEDAYNSLVDVYEVDFGDTTESDAEQVLHRLLLDGESIEEITLEAKSYMRQVTQNGGDVMMIRDWLKSTPWKRDHHEAEGHLGKTSSVAVKPSTSSSRKASTAAC